MIAFRDLLAAGSSRRDLPPGASGEGPAYVFAGALAFGRGKLWRKKNNNHTTSPSLYRKVTTVARSGMRLHVACA